MTKIEWCDKTVNPVVGCTFGCDYCYARKMNKRFGWIENFSDPKFFRDRVIELGTRKPKTIFINSMSDIADWWWWEAYARTDMCMRVNRQNTYLALTKRPFEISKIFYEIKACNFWIGQTITHQENAYIHPLVDFLSVEPLLGEVRLDLADTNVKWVIIGAETGNRKGKVVPKDEWVGQIMFDCFVKGIPVFMKESLVPIVGEEAMERSRCPLEREISNE